MKRALPILVFIFVQLASLAILTLWIVWYAMSRSETSELVKKYGIEPSFHSNVMWLLQGIFLMLPVIAGATLIFIYWNKTRSMDTTRRNFISSVSHELLTPLTSLKLHLETMMMRKTTPEEREKFHKLMMDNSNRLEELISQLLRVSRIEKSKEMYHFVVADLAELIKAYVDENDNLLKKASLELDLDNGCECRVDPTSINTILKNLIENSIKYSDGKAEILLRLKLIEDKVHLTLEDKGNGIQKINLKKVFKMFYRASRTHKGTGLGLFIVRSLVKGNRGKVWATSEGLGKGTMFHITFPKVRNSSGV